MPFMQSKATTVEEYLASLPEHRRDALQAVREVILKNLSPGYQEGMQYGVIGYFVPHSVYPPGYHCDPKQPLPFAGLASQKNYMSVHLMCIYGDDAHREWFIDAWAAEVAKGKAKRLDMGKACVRFKRLEDVPLNVLGRAIKRVTVKKFVAHYESVIKGAGQSKPAAKKVAKKATKKKAAKKAGSKRR
jgi:hypothetical protein